MDGVGKTSLLVAALRAAETRKPEAEGRLFIDPYAERLTGTEGAAILQKALAVSGDQPAIAIRTRYIDDKVKAALQRGTRQIVMLAAGMDSRAFRLNFPTGTRLFELDRAEVLRYKQEKLEGVSPLCDRTTLPVDLREDWSQDLLKAGFQKGRPTLWMVEGLLMYLQETDVTTLFARINSLAAKGDAVLFDILSRTLLEAPFMKEQLRFLEELGARWQFGTDEPEEFMKALGWNAHVIQTGEYIPARWPMPVTPRHVPGVPRGFLVEALKV